MGLNGSMYIYRALAVAVPLARCVNRAFHVCVVLGFVLLVRENNDCSLANQSKIVLSQQKLQLLHNRAHVFENERLQPIIATSTGLQLIPFLG